MKTGDEVFGSDYNYVLRKMRWKWHETWAIKCKTLIVREEPVGFVCEFMWGCNLAEEKKSSGGRIKEVRSKEFGCFFKCWKQKVGKPFWDRPLWDKVIIIFKRKKKGL